jgi:hypothetical protein
MSYLNSYFLHPENKFKYVNDRILWDHIFYRPFPVDCNDKNKGIVILSDYFFVETIFIRDNECFYRETKRICTKPIFHEVESSERNTAFLCLCNFLMRYNRKHIMCYIDIPKHPEVEIKEDYHPIAFYYNSPIYPRIDDNKWLEIDFCNRSFYTECYLYSLNTMDGAFSGNGTSMFYSFQCFCGFLLQY